MKLTLHDHKLKPAFFTVFFLCCCFIQQATAQLQANFTVDKQGGCSPLSVKFTNTTTGASANVTWQWNFGNANTSAIKDPGASYFTEKTYTVTLTAKDGAATSTKTLDITVYKKPIVDFTATPVKGCVPLDVNFTTNATSGDGTISSYLWDFGDGTTIQGNYAATLHTYTFPQTPPVTLNVTNSFGCYTTVTKNNLIEVVKGVTASFTPSVTTLCNVGESITYANTSTGSGTLTYLWDFGDQQTSTDASPVHVYNKKGSFYTTLTVSSSDGCSAIIKSAIINVANFVADFDYPATLCINQAIYFTNKSTAAFKKAEWTIDNSPYSYTNYYDGNFTTSFNQTGEHTIQLVMYYGDCSVTVIKKIVINDVPQLTGFIAELNGACGVPLTINYKDTTTGAVAWNWQNSYYGNTFGSGKNAAFTYTSGGSEYVYLTVTNAAGCSSSTGKYIYYDKPNVYISVITSNNNNNQGCTGLTLQFQASPDTVVKDYQWNFGDNSPISTEKTPTHIFSKPGNFTVALSYTTSNGCKGTVYYYNVAVVDKPVFNFTSSQTTICGNTADTLTATPYVSGWNYTWTFNDQYYYSNYGATVINKFTYDTTYTVKLVVYNYGCADTVIKTNYLKVLPPFPHIQYATNTCDGTRGDMVFTEDSQKAITWKWDFGDKSSINYNAFKDTIRHTYASTGKYNVVLSTTNGACTVKDSVMAYVLLKQKPVLASQKTDACGSDAVNFTLSGFELNPAPYYSYYEGYYLSRTEYGDLSVSNATVTMPNNNYYNYWQTTTSGTIQSLIAGKNDLRMISTSSYFGCSDTSNFIPIKIHGPEAGFTIAPHSGCFKDPLFFTDTSRQSGNSKIVSWEWDFGDYKTQTFTASATVSHTYAAPGYYNVRLKVTDADGCSNQTDYYVHNIVVGGPKADFNASAYNVPPNTVVNFYNNSAFYDYNASLEWTFSDSSKSTDPYTSFTFIKEGVHTVQLVAKNLQTGCTDTVVKTITVRKVNSVFQYNLSYINNNSCPPVIATFTSVSTNAVRLSWNFGDGGIAGDQKVVSHTYNQPGIYRVVHYSYDSNIGVDSTEDFIEIKGPYALLKADLLSGCNSLQVKLTADVKYASDYTWDFGDGTVVPTTDTFSVHTYLTPGIYIPALILKDAGGCSATSSLPDKIIVDSLSASFKALPGIICDSAFSSFDPAVYSLSSDQLQAPVQYTWVIKEGNSRDTLYSNTATHYFHLTGAHAVNLFVVTPYGCSKQITDSVFVKPGVTAAITGPDNVCKGASAIFIGSVTQANTALQWKWDFSNGNLSDTQSPLPQQFIATGTRQVSLIVNNGYCSDTVLHPIIVNPLPVIGFTPSSPFVCRGKNLQLTASGGSTYQWTASTAIVNANAATISAAPKSNIFYAVKATDIYGCTNSDSILVKVIDTLKLTGAASLFACEGFPVQLNVSGAAKYQWISNTAGISNTAIANPSLLTNTSGTYTVVGYDNFNCFTDTVAVYVRISRLPLVDAGQGRELISGTAVTLNPVISGAINWLWSPPDYLNCTDCLQPVSKPASSITYKLTAYNADGCKASDTVSLKLICKNNLVYIPNAFSPNNDARNERFVITGSGIKSIRSISVFSRWGKLVFSRKNVSINDRSNSWDGYFNGEPMPPGAYVYAIQTECEAGEIFEYRGTVMLVR